MSKNNARYWLGKKILDISKEKHYNWKGGQYKSFQGYIFILHKQNHLRALNNGYVKKAILITEKKIGRLLTKKEVVHHINGIKDDDRPENLYLFPSNSKHMRYHRLKNKPKLKSNLIKK